MTGEVADGLVCHVFTSERYLRGTTLPAVAEGAETAGRSLADIEVSLPVTVVTGRDEQERDAVAAAARSQIAFYGSTPAYRGVLDAHGWGELHEQLHAASVRGEWDRMADMVDDEVVAAFTVVAEPERVGLAVRERFGDIVDRVSLATAYTFSESEWARVAADLRG
ncbi:MAG: LLM class flavin-dependent oxidoreductase [Nitriliruptor sp.]|uniref:LLM class flavin-dependent oxidoreductase n=1 Tax=Nitriliruptor sp. TaxID=2448056 RepID=UPI0034A074D2